jgi:3-deoxy-manno-octulosonate cytidylyltransferase (CMP-KDO synthetase)
MTVNYHIVIPARMASRRLPGKPLLDVAGKSLIERVYQRASLAGAGSVVIATDDEQIARAAGDFGARAILTSADHESGSDRIAECLNSLGWGDDTLVVNLQGDEPLMPPACLDQAAALLASDPSADAASLYWPISEPEEVADPNVVKVVTAQDGTALYFSRAVIPHPRDTVRIADALRAGVRWKRHIGLYAYRAGALRAFTSEPPTPLEKIEKLEQLRFLESGRRIVMARATEFIPAGVDTPDDLLRVRRLFTSSD